MTLGKLLKKVWNAAVRLAGSSLISGPRCLQSPARHSEPHGKRLKVLVSKHYVMAYFALSAALGKN